MRTTFLSVAALVVMGAPLLAQSAIGRRPAPNPCTAATRVADSARYDVMSVLTSQSPLIEELRRDVGMTKSEEFTPVTIVRDRATCLSAVTASRLAVGADTPIMLLKLGPVYYLRDPDQKRSTGVIMDSGFKVLLHLDRKVP